MARSYRYLHYDVFTDHLFGGNQLAVFLDGRGLSAETMQAIAKEMNFSETTFVLPPETPGTDVRMRIFTPGEELPMAGHPTIGTTFALARAGVIERGRQTVRVRLRHRPGAGGDDVERRRSQLRVDDAAAAGLRRADSGSGADGGGAVALARGGRGHRSAGAGRLVRRAVSLRAADRRARAVDNVVDQRRRARRRCSRATGDVAARRVRLLGRAGRAARHRLQPHVRAGARRHRRSGDRHRQRSARLLPGAPQGRAARQGGRR